MTSTPCQRFAPPLSQAETSEARQAVMGNKGKAIRTMSTRYIIKDAVEHSNTLILWPQT